MITTSCLNLEKLLSAVLASLLSFDLDEKLGDRDPGLLVVLDVKVLLEV